MLRPLKFYCNFHKITTFMKFRKYYNCHLISSNFVCNFLIILNFSKISLRFRFLQNFFITFEEYKNNFLKIFLIFEIRGFLPVFSKIYYNCSFVTSITCGLLLKFFCTLPPKCYQQLHKTLCDMLRSI